MLRVKLKHLRSPSPAENFANLLFIFNQAFQTGVRENFSESFSKFVKVIEQDFNKTCLFKDEPQREINYIDAK